MKKAIFTLNINDYAPDITAITYPRLQAYANRIGADFIIISERKFPEWDIDYEKLQIYELGRGYDWNIYIDGDALLHPDLPDLTELVPKDMVLNHGVDFAPFRWKYDQYFRRSGQHISACNWFAMASDWCLDLWHPLELTPEEAYANISITQLEKNRGIDPKHLASDYALSRNIARYGLRFNTVKQLFVDMKIPDANFFHHLYTVSDQEKLESMHEAIKLWDKP